MIKKAHFLFYTLLLAMVFSTVAVFGQTAPVSQAELLTEAIFYVH